MLLVINLAQLFHLIINRTSTGDNQLQQKASQDTVHGLASLTLRIAIYAGYTNLVIRVELSPEVINDDRSVDPSFELETHCLNASLLSSVVPVHCGLFLNRSC